MNVHLEGFPALLTTLILFFVVLVVPVSIVAFVLSEIHKKRIRRKYLNLSAINAEYDPPLGLSPAEIGYLFDSKIGNKELVATILDLEQRKILKIDKTYENTLNIYKISDNYKDLKLHEQLIIDNLSVFKNIEITSHVILLDFNKVVRRSLANNGYISPKISFIGYFIGKTLVIYISIVVALIIYFVFLTKGDLIFLVTLSILVFVLGFPLFLAFALVSAYINNLVSGHSGLWNQKARSIWPDIEGYREYVRQVELDELQFESEKLKIKSKNKTLPYAVALGLNTKWQERFKN